jgi:hypothetical protein
MYVSPDEKFISFDGDGVTFVVQAYDPATQKFVYIGKLSPNNS